MMAIIAVIKPFRFDEIVDALHAIGVNGMTVTEVKGHGRQRGHVEHYRGAEYSVDFIPKIRLEILVDDDAVERTVNTIVETGRTDKIGDGKVRTAPAGDVVRIRTGEHGPQAI